MLSAVASFAFIQNWRSVQVYCVCIGVMSSWEVGHTLALLVLRSVFVRSSSALYESYVMSVHRVCLPLCV